MTQRPGDLFGGFFDEKVEFARSDPAAFGDFAGMKIKGAGKGAEDRNFDEFVAGFGSGGELEQGAKREGLVVPAEFLAEFTSRGGHVIFTGIDMAAARGVPAVGEGVLARAAALQEEVPGVVVDEDVNGAMPKLFGVDFASRSLGDDLVVNVDYVEKFVWVGFFHQNFH